MTSKIEVPRELLERWLTDIGESKYVMPYTAERRDQIRALLCAPEAPRQSPIGWFTDDYLTDKSATTYDELTSNRWKDKGWPVQPLYHAPLSPDHSGGGARVVFTREHVEIVAESIYWQWAGREGFVPWVKGGNSLEQDKARSIAWSTLNKVKELNQ